MQRRLKCRGSAAEMGNKSSPIMTFRVPSAVPAVSSAATRAAAAVIKRLTQDSHAQFCRPTLEQVGNSRSYSAAFLQQVADTMESGRHWRWK
jgi:hypothetical protein